MLCWHSLRSHNYYTNGINKRIKIILFSAYCVFSENEPKFGFIQLCCAWTLAPKNNIAALNICYLLSSIARDCLNFSFVLFLMIHLSLQTRERATRSLWFAAAGSPLPSLLPWKHVLDEVKPGIDIKYMISKTLAFLCEKPFASSLYKTLGEEETPLRRGNFSRCPTGVAVGAESILPPWAHVFRVKYMRQGRVSRFWSWCCYSSGIWGQENSALM